MIVEMLELTTGNITFDKMNYRDNEIEIKKVLLTFNVIQKYMNTLSAYELLNMCCNIYEVNKLCFLFFIFYYF